MEDPRIISALFIFLKMAYYNVLINKLRVNTDGWKMGCIGSRKLKYSQECDTLSIEQPCYRVADLYSYIEWGWC